MAEKRNKKKAKKRHPRPTPWRSATPLTSSARSRGIPTLARLRTRLMTVEERLYKLWEERSGGKMELAGRSPRCTSRRNVGCVEGGFDAMLYEVRL